MRSSPARLALAVVGSVLAAIGWGLAAEASQEATGVSHPAGVIRGKVDVQRDPGAAEPGPHVADLAMSLRRDAPTRRQSIVYLETAPQGAFEDAGVARASLDQKDEAFLPYVLPIVVGTIVDFPNRDRTYHNVFSLSRVKSFDLGRYARGQSKSVLFDHPGVVRVFCDIHSHMSAYILVFAHRFFAATDPEGRYHIDGVPAGSYELSVWTDGRVRETRPVRVPEGGGAVEADFVVR
jgi:plastocyanin